MTNLTKKSEFYDMESIISYQLCVIRCLFIQVNDFYQEFIFFSVT